MRNYEELMLKAYAMYWHASYNNLRSKLKQISKTAEYPDDYQTGFNDIMDELEKLDKFQGFDIKDFEKNEEKEEKEEKKKKKKKKKKKVKVYLKGPIPVWIRKDFAEFLEPDVLDYNGECDYAYLDEDDAEAFAYEITRRYSEYFKQYDDYCFEYKYK